MCILHVGQMVKEQMQKVHGQILSTASEAR